MFPDVEALKLIPVIVTVVPTTPVDGENSVMTGITEGSPSELHDAMIGTMRLDIPNRFRNSFLSIAFFRFNYPNNGVVTLAIHVLAAFATKSGFV